MFRRTTTAAYFWSIAKLKHPSPHGYELATITDERMLKDFLRVHRKKITHVFITNGGEKCPLSKKFLTSLHHVPLGDPTEVRIAMIDGLQSPALLEEQTVVALPSVLLFHEEKCVEKVTGMKPQELMIKSRFLLRNLDKEVYSCAI